MITLKKLTRPLIPISYVIFADDSAQIIKSTLAERDMVVLMFYMFMQAEQVKGLFEGRMLESRCL
ncbi:hypothetical protein D1AOALGA4SA_28 [Olavius algarvensis Delta 1 endosymbiont]|nr:hypothetical protein D1AOALGA4SA_28 [Olavius algarvensis Delta 1 endosymbiont]